MSTMKWSNSLTHYIRSNLSAATKYTLLVSAPTFLFVLVVFLLTKMNHIPFSDIVQDPSSITGFPPYIGFISNIGILVWCSSSAISLFSAYILFAAQRNNPFVGFFLWSGLFSALLMIDDLFMLHDSVLYVNFHINENVVYVVYFAMIFLFFRKYHKLMQGTPFLIFAFAIGFFLFSTVIDKVPGSFDKLGFHVLFDEDLLNILEEGPKLIAIMNWLAYYFITSIQQINLLFNRQS